jgi:hypothetical protein
MVAVFASLVLAATALALDRFTDPRGDADGGPDVTAVTLSHTDAVLSIAVEFAQAPPLGFDEREQYTDMLLVGIHTDDDLSRADVEFWTGVHGVDLTRAVVVRGENRGVAGNADVIVDGSTVTLEVPRVVLDDPDHVAVSVAAGREYVDGQASGGGDFAPASGSHRYQLTDGGGSAWVWPLVASGLVAVGVSAVAVLVVRRRRLGEVDGPPGTTARPAR